MVRSLMEIGTKAKCRVMVSFCMLIKMCTKVNLFVIRLMEKVLINKYQEKCMKDTGLTINHKVKAYRH